MSEDTVDDQGEGPVGITDHELVALVDMGVTREIAAARGRLQRMDVGREPEAYQAAFAELVALEGRRRALRQG